MAVERSHKLHEIRVFFIELFKGCTQSLGKNNNLILLDFQIYGFFFQLFLFRFYLNNNILDFIFAGDKGDADQDQNQTPNTKSQDIQKGKQSYRGAFSRSSSHIILLFYWLFIPNDG
jgi:hypothetical protein